MTILIGLMLVKFGICSFWDFILSLLHLLQLASLQRCCTAFILRNKGTCFVLFLFIVFYFVCVLFCFCFYCFFVVFFLFVIVFFFFWICCLYSFWIYQRNSTTLLKNHKHTNGIPITINCIIFSVRSMLLQFLTGRSAWIRYQGTDMDIIVQQSNIYNSHTPIVHQCNKSLKIPKV